MPIFFDDDDDEFSPYAVATRLPLRRVNLRRRSISPPRSRYFGRNEGFRYEVGDNIFGDSRYESANRNFEDLRKF